MAVQQVYMDVPAVQALADTFTRLSDICKAVSKALEAASVTLRATAFVGMVGGAAVDRYINILRPKVDDLAKKCTELNGDLRGAIMAYRDGDTSGSKRFQN
jgi:hypothetical protein